MVNESLATQSIARRHGAALGEPLSGALPALGSRDHRFRLIGSGRYALTGSDFRACEPELTLNLAEYSG